LSNLFHKLEIEAFRKGLTLRTKESQNWFRKRVTGLRPDRNALMKEEPIQLKNTGIAGNMYMFFYDPKHKQTLPFYDAFPLVIPIGPAKGGFYGLNLHYLPPALRAKLLDGLLDNLNNRLYDESTQFKINMQLLNRASNLKWFKPCLKHYLNDHVRSRFAMVESPEWEIATFLPTASFQKASKTAVWKDSRSKI
tara:strand:- start:2048 stop:2629 length:582 start_codon:yes stop_codon:yes gene_type:complete